MRKIALDLGAGNMKVAEVINGAVYHHTLPSVFGPGEIKDMGLLTVGMKRQSTANAPVTVRYAGTAHVVGEYADDHVRVGDRLTFERFGDPNAMKPLIYAALSSRMNGGPYEANLVVGLPVELMQDRDRAKTIFGQMKKWLTGDHTFQVNDKIYHVTIGRIRATSQPLGAYNAYGRNPQGDWIKGEDIWDSTAVIVDIGFHTVDMFAVRSGQLVSRYTGGQNLGMHRVSRIIAQSVYDRHGAKYSLHQIDRIIRQNQRRVDYPGGSADITGLVETALSDAFSDLAEFLNSRIGDGQYRLLIFVGGGAEAMRDKISQAYPAAIILQNAVVANAIGLAKLANSKNFLA